jgi:hypothetical protein
VSSVQGSNRAGDKGSSVRGVRKRRILDGDDEERSRSDRRDSRAEKRAREVLSWIARMRDRGFGDR